MVINTMKKNKVEKRIGRIGELNFKYGEQERNS